MRKLIFIILAVLISGCITTTSGNVNTPAPKEEIARLNLELGIGYLRQNELEQARTKLEKSIQNNPDNPDAHRTLGLVYERMGELESAEKEYRIALRQAPDAPDVMEQLAVYLCLHGDVDEALKLFNRAVEIPLNPQRYVIYTNAGTCVKRQENLELAETYLRRALELNVQYATALLQMSDVAYRRENFLQSRAFVERYLTAADPSPAVLWLAYRVENALGDKLAADNFAKRLLRNFPRSAEARELLEQRRNAG
jgi:type IV pilus assembly protein PilF